MALSSKETEFVVKFSYKENCKPNDLLENSTKLLWKKYEFHTNSSKNMERGIFPKSFYEAIVVVVQSLSHVRLFATPWTTARQTSPSITNSQSLLKFMSVESVTSSNNLILCHPLLFLHSIFSSTRFFSKESDLSIKWPKYWSFSFSISPSNEHSGLISFRIDWLDLAVQGTLKCLLQNHSSKASVLWC